MRKLGLLICLGVTTAVPSASSATHPLLVYGDGALGTYVSFDGGASAHRLTRAAAEPFALSPDGTRVLVVSGRGLTRLALLSVANGKLTPIRGTADADSGSITPDGTHIVFSTMWAIYRIPVGGGTRARLLDSPAGIDIDLPAMSPDGKWIAFVTKPSSKSDSGPAEPGKVEVIPAAGGHARVLATGANGDPADGGRLAWSPDGSRLVYVGHYEPSTRGIWAVAPGGGGRVRLTKDIDTSPAFTHDGSTIYFSRFAGSAGADDESPSPKDPLPVGDDFEELWSMRADGARPSVIREGAYTDLVVGRPVRSR